MSRITKGVCLTCTACLMFIFVACSNNLQTIDFSLDTSTSNEIVFSTNHDIESAEFSIALKTVGGRVVVRVNDISNSKLIWYESFNSDKDFKIALTSLKNANKYSLLVQTIETEETSVQIAFDKTLINIL